MLLKLLIASASLVVAAAPAPSPSAAPLPNARYALERMGDTLVRLDRQTGQVSYCRMEGPAGLVCRLAADERAAYETKISSLTDQLGGPAPRAGKQSLAEKKADAAGEISLVEYILKQMIHSAREVADTAEREHMAPPRNRD